MKISKSYKENLVNNLNKLTDEELKNSYISMFKRNYFPNSEIKNDVLYSKHIEEREFLDPGQEFEETWEIFVSFEDKIKIELYADSHPCALYFVTYDKPQEVASYINGYFHKEDLVLC